MNLEEAGGKPSTDKVLVVGKIYATWCSACNHLQPIWLEMIDIMKTDPDSLLKDRKLVYAEIESAEEDSGKKDINARYLMNSSEKLELQGGYPTIFKINNGRLEYYNGARDAKKMYRWFTANRTRFNGGKTKKSTNSKKRVGRHNRKMNRSARKSIWSMFGL